MREPIVLDRSQIRIRKLLRHIHRARPLNRQLCVRVAQVFDHAVEILGVLAHPPNVFFPCPRVNHQQVILFAEPVHNDIVHKRAFRIKHRRIMRLSNRQQGSVVHAEMLHGCERPARFVPGPDANVAHVAHVKNANAVSNRFVLRDKSATRRVLDGHVPAAEIDHLRA